MDETASTSRKRQRDPESGSSDGSLLLEDSLALTDTFVAVRMMSAQFPYIEKVSVRPFVLQSQLYCSIKDRTQVDRELESLKREKMVRIFKLYTGRDDRAIMLLEEYLSQIEHVVKIMEEKKKEKLPVFEWFKAHIISSKLDPCIGHHELCSLLSLGGKVKEEHVSLLINAGLLCLKNED
ncbi:unnamed protein product [Cuscuta epithymum]|uniref:Uncharacterized protein n=1 Tax=Cuscuta epithymum TaxID=186058 RepID=A0AAV0C0K6_9ASTE|nr:unnamed protein product [Cuscuta epithymum]